jgi:hypothetical protein
MATHYTLHHREREGVLEEVVPVLVTFPAPGDFCLDIPPNIVHNTPDRRGDWRGGRSYIPLLCGDFLSPEVFIRQFVIKYVKFMKTSIAN